MSLYSLIVEPDTPLLHWVETGHVPAPDQDAAATFYEFAMARLARAGYTQYEVSNWAKTPNEETPDFAPDASSPANIIYSTGAIKNISALDLVPTAICA